VLLAERDLGSPASTPAEHGRAPAAPRAGEPAGGAAALTVRDALTSQAVSADLSPPIAAAADAPGDPRALCADGRADPLFATPEQPPADTLDRQAWGCWMAAEATAAGLPPTLPLMAALAHSGLRNLSAGEHGAGFFALDAGAAYAPPGHGLPRDAQPDAAWWLERPDAQLDAVLRRLGDAGGGARDAQLDDPAALGRWAAEADAGALDATAFADAHAGAAALVETCRDAPAATSAAIAAARSQLGVHELGVNAGPAVDRYLAAAGAGSGNPWCAGFVTWSVEQAGRELPGEGWAAVSTWVAAAQAGEHGLSIVDAADARPGDVVAFDWGGGGDFGSDAHIGFLDSAVAADGTFTTVEGNAGDAVAQLQRSTADGTVVFLRLDA
jgi:hypothetical protein